MKIVGEWIAVSQKQFVGRGQVIDDEFEVLERDSTIHFSQRELMRHRVRIHPDGRLENWRRGLLWREGTLDWDGEQGNLSPDGQTQEWSVLDPGNWALDEWKIIDQNTLERVRFDVETGSFCQEETTIYRRLQTITVGQQDRTALERAIGDQDIADLAGCQCLNLRQWTLDPAALMVLLERPELRSVQSVNLSGVRVEEATELIDVLCGTEHSSSVVNWTLDGLQGTERFLKDRPRPNIEALSVVRCGLKDVSTLGRHRNLKELDLSYNPIQSLDVLTQLHHLETFGGEGLGELPLTEKQYGRLRSLRCDAVASVNFPKMERLSTRQFSLEALTTSPLLSDLTLREHRLSNEEWQAIIQRPLLGLHCEAMDLSTEQLLELFEAPIGASIQALSITKQQIDEEIVDLLANGQRFPQLKSLSLRHTGCSLSTLCQSGGLTRIERLFVDGCREWQASLRANGLVSVKYLSLRGAQVDIVKWLREQAFVSLDVADLGQHSPIQGSLRNSVRLKRLRLDEHSRPTRQQMLEELRVDREHRNTVFHHLPIDEK